MEGGPVIYQISLVVFDSICAVSLRRVFRMADTVSLIVGEGEVCGHRLGCQFAEEMAPGKLALLTNVAA